jgi:anthranilate phosphoribosyltransferase
MKELLMGRGRQAVRSAVVMNAGAALYIAGKAASVKEGVALAEAALQDGSATKAAEAYILASAKS